MDTTHIATARRLIDAALTDGGASEWLGEQADHGFLVGLPGRGCIFTRAERQRDPDAVLRQAAVWVKGTGTVEGAATRGSWLDAETGTLYLDLSSHHADFSEALNALHVRGELALWDVADAVERRP